MSKNKIIIIFVALLLVMVSGYFIYNYQQKVSMAKFYYNSGDYKKAADLDVGKVSDNASYILNAMNWKENINKYLKYNDKFYISSLQTEIGTIYTENLLYKHGAVDKKFVDILNKYYEEIAEYLGVSIDKLDEIAQDSTRGETELLKLLEPKRVIYIK